MCLDAMGRGRRLAVVAAASLVAGLACSYALLLWECMSRQSQAGAWYGWLLAVMVGWPGGRDASGASLRW